MSAIMEKIAAENAARKLAKKNKERTKVLKFKGQEGTAVVGRGWGISRVKDKNSVQVPGVGTVDVSMGNARPKNPRSVEN